MTQTLHTVPLPHAGLRVVVAHQPADDRGAVLYMGEFETPLGPIIALGAEGVLWGLGFAREMGAEAVLTDLARRFPRARLLNAPEALEPAIDALLTGNGEVRVRLVGTEFQRRVWTALLDVPSGSVISYAGLAAEIGTPNAVRAVGTAVGQNPVSWAVPCHRVTRIDGRIGGYHWGEGIKRILLAREGASVIPLAIAKL